MFVMVNGWRCCVVTAVVMHVVVVVVVALVFVGGVHVAVAVDFSKMTVARCSCGSHPQCVHSCCHTGVVVVVAMDIVVAMSGIIEAAVAVVGICMSLVL